MDVGCLPNHPTPPCPRTHPTHPFLSCGRPFRDWQHHRGPCRGRAWCGGSGWRRRAADARGRWWRRWRRKPVSMPTEPCPVKGAVAGTWPPAEVAPRQHENWPCAASDPAGSTTTRPSGGSRPRPCSWLRSASFRRCPARDEVGCGRRASRAARRLLVHDCPAAAGYQLGVELTVLSYPMYRLT